MSDTFGQVEVIGHPLTFHRLETGNAREHQAIAQITPKRLGVVFRHEVGEFSKALATYVASPGLIRRKPQSAAKAATQKARLTRERRNVLLGYAEQIAYVLPQAVHRAIPLLLWTSAETDDALEQEIIKNSNDICRVAIHSSALRGVHDNGLLENRALKQSEKHACIATLVRKHSKKLASLLSLFDSLDWSGNYKRLFPDFRPQGSDKKSRVADKKEFFRAFSNLRKIIITSARTFVFDHLGEDGFYTEEDLDKVVEDLVKRLGYDLKNPGRGFSLEFPDFCVYSPRIPFYSPSERPRAGRDTYRSADFKFPSLGPTMRAEVGRKREQQVSCWGGHFDCFALRDALVKNINIYDYNFYDSGVQSKIEGRAPDFLFGYHDQKQRPIRCGYKPKGVSSSFWFGIDETVTAIHTALQAALKGREVGLVAICGETSAAKSQHTLGLIYERLREKSKLFRATTDAIDANCAVPFIGYEYTHLLTIEEPIEDYLFSIELDGKRCPIHPSEIARFGVHYTPRDMLIDFAPADERSRLYPGRQLSPLATALQLDALRMKPTVVLVGESRNEDDLKEVVRFAATGHQIYTTFHSGSLQEGLAKVLRAWEARTSSERGEVASRIYAIIHLRSGTIQGKGFALPSVWIGTERALDGLVKDGLRSVVPQRTPASEESAVLGRTYFAEWLESQPRKGPPIPFRDICHTAIGWDLDER